MNLARLTCVSLISSVTAIIVAGANIYHALEPDMAWCAAAHMICRWGGTATPDPVWWSDEAIITRLLDATRASAPPIKWFGPLDTNSEIISGYPQRR